MSGKPKILITGGLGNVGSWLVEHLSKQYDIYVLTRGVKYQLKCNYTIIEADIANLSELQEKIVIDFDYCIHTASYNEHFEQGYAHKALMVNTLGTRNLLEVLSKTSHLQQFVYLSTFHVYGVNSGHITEQTPTKPKNDYASTHLFAEYYVKQFFNSHQVPFVIFRLSNAYGVPKFIGSSKWYLILNDLVRGAYQNQEIILVGDGKGLRDFVWLGDVCKIIESSLTRVVNDTINLSSQQCYQMLDIAKFVQTQYTKRYQKEIIIQLGFNTNPSNKHPDILPTLQVSHQKLLQYIEAQFHCNFEKEIDQIFDLLEANKIRKNHA